MGIHRTWASGLEPFMGPPAGRARSPQASAPTIVGGRRIFSPKKTRGPLPPKLGRLVSVFPAPSVIS
jgi:hypothetical protein